MSGEGCDICGGPAGAAFCEDCGRGPLCEGCWSEHQGNASRCPEADEPQAGDPGDEQVTR
jgi:hypothetical protein